MITRNNSTQIPGNAASIVWLVILTVVSVGGSLVISCVTPFAALAVALAGTVRLRVALRAMIAIWLTNQFIGFVFLHFPRTPDTVLSGLAIGAATLLSTLVAASTLQAAASLPTLARLGLALLLAFGGYEASLFVSALFLGGVETFSPAIIAQIGFVNLLWFVGLIALNELVAALCKTGLGIIPRLAKMS